MPGRRRININGGIDLDRPAPAVRFHDTANADSTISSVGKNRTSDVSSVQRGSQGLREASMRFEEAMGLMRAGKVVAREGWQGTNLVLDDGEIKRQILRNLDGVVMGYRAGIFSEDLVAEDWIVVAPRRLRCGHPHG
jgi:hypothetical protein